MSTAALLTVIASILAAAAVVSTFLWKLLDAIRGKARFEQRVENHLSSTAPMIVQFQAMQTAIVSGENRHQAITDELRRFVGQQDELNQHFRSTLDYLLKRKEG